MVNWSLQMLFFRNQLLMYFTDRWSDHLRESQKKGSCRAIPVAQAFMRIPVRELRISHMTNLTLPQKKPTNNFPGIFISFRGGFYFVNTGID